MNDTFMKEKPILPLLTSMALPMVISMLVNSLYNIVDSFFVAQINEQAMAALSLVFPVQNFVNATAIGFGVGINAMIAFHLGAGNKENANAYLNTTQIAVKLAERAKLNITDGTVHKLGKALKKHNYLRLKRNGSYVYALYEKSFDEVETENKLAAYTETPKDNSFQSQFRFKNEN